MIIIAIAKVLKLLTEHVFYFLAHLHTLLHRIPFLYFSKQNKLNLVAIFRCTRYKILLNNNNMSIILQSN